MSDTRKEVDVRVGVAAWDTGHGQPNNPDLFECLEAEFHFPCGMCEHKYSDPNVLCIRCKHYCP